MAAAPLPPAAPPPQSRRDLVLDAIRRGPVRQRELVEQYGISSALVHVDSLRLEGHVIETLRGVNPETQLPDTLIRLVKDAWAGERQWPPADFPTRFAGAA